MAVDREPNNPTDSEDAPLLQDPGNEYSGNNAWPRKKSLSDRINEIANEPFTTLTKILVVVSVILLLLASVFIGLFAGAEHKLKLERGSRHNKPITTTTFVGRPTATTTEVFTTSVPGVPLPTGEPRNGVCTSSECVLISASIIEGLDESQDPCEEFYQFSNGGWFAKNDIPPGKSSFGSFEKLSQDNKRIIRKIIEPSESNTSNIESPSYDDQTKKKIQDLYVGCMNEDLLNKRGQEPILDVVNTIRTLYRSETWKDRSNEAEDQATFSGREAVSQADGYGLTTAIAYLHSRGIGALFDFGVDGDVGEDPNFMTLWFSQPDLGLPSKEYYEEEPIRKLYKDTLARILLALDESNANTKSVNVEGDETEEKVKVWPPWPWPPWGDDDDEEKKDPLNDTEQAYVLAEKILEFETRIANASLDIEDLYLDPIGTYNPRPFEEFASQLPQINFPTYFSTFTPRAFPTRVILTSTTYAPSLSAILSNTSAEVVEAYLVTRVGLKLAPYLGQDTQVWKANRELEETLQGIKKGQVPDRSDWCIQRVEESLGFAVGRFFVQETFGGDSKQKGTKVITDVIDAFKESLKHLSWMDKESATAAAEKADAILVKVGYPLSPDTESAVSIARYYSLVLVDKEMFLESIVSSWISDEYKKWQLLGKQRDFGLWEMYPSMVNAYFNPPANEIVFPAGILRSPFFATNWPAYLQYGAFGAVAAHELTHAFDSSGRLYNQHGKLEQWWTNATSDNFKEIQDCIAEQFSNYTIDDGKGGKVHVNGNLTSGENIGDTGFIQTYRAWRSQFQASAALGQEYLLPGLNYTQEQLFFIAYGQIWARSIKPAAAVQRIRTDPHSPNKFRVEGTLYNVPEFAKAFNCKKGAKLNPPNEKRCILW